MFDLDSITNAMAAPPLSPRVREILHHVCREESQSYGAVVEWCETRGDCHHVVVCPACSVQFLVDEDELAELRRSTDAEGVALVCGVRWD
jgi:hypothetical protein